VRLGVVILPTMRWPEAEGVWRRAEALGAHTGWTYDHLTWRDLAEGPWFSALPLLSAVATATSRMRLGTLVTSPNFRHPVPFAKEVMTLDDLSTGRLTLGIGAGTEGHDASALGTTPWSRRERTGRFEEFVGQLDHLLANPTTARLEGEYYAAVGARALPGCVQRPRVPFAIAGGGPRAIALAARHGQTWVTLGDPRPDADDGAHEAAVRGQLRALEAACEAIGRDAGTIDRLYLQGVTSGDWLESVERFRDLAGRYEALGFTDLALHWPRTAPPYVADPDVFEAILVAGGS
jgi:alkanesulfonate monooxygenase SsuD/methylene tetrahydromethanopterin reductase-like flavin-dependent oxidoreductase (luciferase family)